MAVSVSVLAIVISLHLIAFIFAVGAEQRRSTAKVVPDEYDERTYCVYTTDASTVYGLSALGLLLISQTVLNGVTRCLCFGRGLMRGTTSATCAVFFFIFSWYKMLPGNLDQHFGVFVVLAALIAGKSCVFSKRMELCFSLESVDLVQLRVSFLAAEACLLAGSARNAYHTKYRGFFGVQDLSCTTLRKGVFAAGAALVLLSMLSSVFYYWLHSRADTGGWQKHQNEGLGMTSPSLSEDQHQNTSEFSKGQTV
ncbi:DESIGUAL/Modifying wall lignin-1/2 [Dillenia turbinata]|uniref:DESIGUAL/Modifying wall lignin-1/2 n=1 Tax=Dillenia turbinata TaxID=194707 RepID=A0AAN8VDL4_9MAGN